MRLTEEQLAVLDALQSAESDDFVELARQAGLDPRHDFVGADLRGVDFGSSDLAGFDFTGADLTEAKLSHADISRANLFAATLLGTSLPGFELNQGQAEAVVSIIDHLRLGKRRALASIPTGYGVTRIIASLVSYLHDDGPGHAGLILCSSLATKEQLLQMLARTGMTDVRYLVRNEPLAPTEQWRIATYNEVISRVRAAGAQQLPRLSGPLILTEADHLTFRNLTPILASFVENVQVAFISGVKNRSSKIAQHFRHDTVIEISLEQARQEGAVRTALILDRRTAVGPSSANGELDLKQTADAAGDFVATLANEGLLLSKSIFLCTSQEQSRIVRDVVETMYQNMVPRDERDATFLWAGIPRSTLQMREWMDDAEGSPRVICCRPSMVGEAFETSPDCVGTILGGIGGRPRALWESARPSRTNPARPVLLVDYTGAAYAPALERQLARSSEP
jgi:hypothetical protein